MGVVRGWRACFFSLYSAINRITSIMLFILTLFAFLLILLSKIVDFETVNRLLNILREFVKY